MKYFTIQARSHREAIEKMKGEYGDNSKILTYRNIRMGGFMGFFAKEGVEVTGYVSAPEKKSGGLDESKMKILEAAKKEQTLNYILKEIKELKQHVRSAPGQGKPLPEALLTVRDLLVQNDFSEEYIEAMIERVREGFPLSELDYIGKIQDAVIDWIAGDVPVPSMRLSGQKPRLFVVVGPTGVGKTTTIAKLAAFYGIESDRRPAQKVRIITIDSYRIGAKKQIEIYGEIMRIPVSAAETKEDLKKLIALYADADLILIDTIGKSQRDFKRLAEMQDILSACGKNAEVHLALSATTKTKDLEDICMQFEPFGYENIIVTKLDETSQIGNIISIVAKRNKAVSFITDGQKVPQDIEEASVIRLLLHLDGFRINREMLEKKYGPGQKALA